MLTVTSTFVFADLAGYTALTEAHGDERAAEVAAAFCEELRALLGGYGAEEVKAVGDALIVRVPDTGQAVHLAARIVGDFGARERALGVPSGCSLAPRCAGATIGLVRRSMSPRASPTSRTPAR